MGGGHKQLSGFGSLSVVDPEASCRSHLDFVSFRSGKKLLLARVVFLSMPKLEPIVWDAIISDFVVHLSRSLRLRLMVFSVYRLASHRADSVFDVIFVFSFFFRISAIFVGTLSDSLWEATPPLFFLVQFVHSFTHG